MRAELTQSTLVVGADSWRIVPLLVTAAVSHAQLIAPPSGWVQHRARPFEHSVQQPQRASLRQHHE